MSINVHECPLQPARNARLEFRAWKLNPTRSSASHGVGRGSGRGFGRVDSQGARHVDSHMDSMGARLPNRAGLTKKRGCPEPPRSGTGHQPIQGRQGRVTT